MKTFLTLTLIPLVSFSPLLLAQDDVFPDSGPPPLEKKEIVFEKSSLIDPEKHIFGHSFGTTEDDFIQKEGNPDGYLQISPKKALMIYGSSIGFVFIDGKLAGVRVNSSLIDWTIANEMTSNSRFHGIAWAVKGGIRNDTSEKEIQKLFGERLKGSDYRQFITYPKVRLDISFSSMTSGGVTTRQVHAILLMKEEKGAGNQDPRKRVKKPKMK